MTEFVPFLKKLITAPGLSGHEEPVRRLIQEAWEPLTDEIHTSRLGSLHGLKRGTGPEPRPSILLATHMDAIGLMVSSIREEFLHVTAIGGVDHRILPGQMVIVHGREDVPGMVVQPPAHLLPADVGSGPVPLEHLLVDTGLPPREVARLVRVGDRISFAQEPLEMGEQVIAGHSLDNRVSVVALTRCLEALQGRSHLWDLWAVATAQEEETLGGAFTSGYALDPDLAVAVDVTFAKSPGTAEFESFPLGEGITLGWGPNIHPGLHRKFKALADALEIPYKLEPMPRYSGTDAYALQVARAGIPTMVVSIPLRYMHTPVEMVSMKDVTRTGRLLAEFVAGLDAAFLPSLSHDE